MFSMLTITLLLYYSPFSAYKKILSCVRVITGERARTRVVLYGLYL